MVSRKEVFFGKPGGEVLRDWVALGALCDAMTEVPRRRARDLHDGVVGQEGGGDIGERGGGDDKDNPCSRHLFHGLALRDASRPEVGTQVSEAVKPGVHLKKSESDFYL